MTGEFDPLLIRAPETLLAEAKRSAQGLTLPPVKTLEGEFGVSCLVVRSITDRADPQAQTNYEQFLATASENAATLVEAIIARLAPSAR